MPPIHNIVKGGLQPFLFFSSILSLWSYFRLLSRTLSYALDLATTGGHST